MGLPTPNHAFLVRNHGSYSDTSGQRFLFAQPRPKHTWFAAFLLSDDVPSDYARAYYEDFRAGRALAAIKSISHPRVNFDTETIRSYNSVRVVPTRMNYDSITVTFHDDSGGFMLGLLREYRKFYHGSASAASTIDFGDEAAVPRQSDVPSMGMTLRATDRHFFRKIVIYDLGTCPDAIHVYNVANPVIKTIDHTDLDYYDGQGFVEVTLSIEYEGYHEYVSEPVSDWSEVFSQLWSSEGFPSSTPNAGVSGGIAGIFDEASDLAFGFSDTLGDVFSEVKRGVSVLGAAFGKGPWDEIGDAVRKAEAATSLTGAAAGRGLSIGAGITRRGDDGLFGFTEHGNAGRAFRTAAESAKSAKDIVERLQIGGEDLLDLIRG